MLRPAKRKKMAKEQRRGDREIRKPKVAKPAVATPISPFAMKTPSGAVSTRKR
jgi:hypothetical protein